MRMILMATSVAALALAGCETEVDNAQTEETVEVSEDKTIGDDLSDDKKFSEAVEAAGLDTVLSGPSQYTVLIPSDTAFEKLPAGSWESLTSEEGKADLTAILSYHILPGTMLAEDIGKAIEAGNGSAQIVTMGGETLTATKDGEEIVITDSSNGIARVTSADDKRSNGVIHRIDTVLMPKK